MSTTIKLVAGDTRPQVVVDLKDQDGLPINLSGGTVRMYFRKAGSTDVLQNIVGTLLTGFRDEDGVLTTTAPYNVAGVGGRASFNWPAGALDVEQGNYEGEVEITFSDDSVQTVYEKLKFKVRADF